MKKWLPIRKVTAGAVLGVLTFFLEMVPAWHHHIPLNVQILLPFAAAMIAAYVTKLETRYIH